MSASNKKIFLIVLSAIIFCFMAFNNKYPLLNNNSESFLINNAKSGNSAYSNFILHSSWNLSLWFTVLTQSLFTSILLFYIFNNLTPSGEFYLYYIAFVFFATFFMSASITISTIDTTVFAPIAFLGAGLLLLTPGLRRGTLIVTSILFEVSILMDISNLVCIFFVVVIYVPVFYIVRGVSYTNSKLNVKGLYVLMFLIIIGWFCQPISQRDNLFEKGKMVLGYSSKVNNALRIMQKVGFGEIYLTRFSDITIPNYRQITKQGNLIEAIEKKYNSELRECVLSDLTYGTKRFTFISNCQLAGIIGAILSYLFLAKKLDEDDFKYITYFFLILVVYALINTVLQKKILLQGQVVWLMVLPLFRHLSKANFFQFKVFDGFISTAK
jgi:hypothetical protein